MTGKIDPKSWEGHTPGPWQWGYDGSDASQPVVVIAVSSGETVCRIEPWTDRQDRADAALCAASPDLAARVAELEAERDELVAAARSVDGQEAHRVLPAVWPIIQRMAKGDPA